MERLDFAPISGVLDYRPQPDFRSWAEQRPVYPYKDGNLQKWQPNGAFYQSSQGFCNSYRGRNLLKAHYGDGTYPIRGKIDGGHPFRLVKIDLDRSDYIGTQKANNGVTTIRNVVSVRPPAGLAYSGWDSKFGPSTWAFTGVTGVPAMRTDDQVLALGPSAIARANPSKPQMDLLYSLLELWRDPPLSHEALKNATGLQKGSIPRNIAKNASSAYLSTQMAILPTISDGKKLYDTIRRSSDILRLYHERAGILQRKRIELFYDEPKNLIRSVDTGASALSKTFYNLGPVDYRNIQLETITMYRERIWFSGAFEYFASQSGTLAAEIEDYEKLFGSPGPSTAWNLMPWSWMADWFGNFNSVIQNISYLADSSTIMRWGYLMHSHESVVTSTLTGDLKWQSIFAPWTVGVRAHIISKQKFNSRFRANPYYISASLPNFTAKQLAIMGALGIQKLF